MGRVLIKGNEAIVKGENPPEPGIPESFNVLMKEIQSLALDIRAEKKKELHIKEKEIVTDRLNVKTQQ